MVKHYIIAGIIGAVIAFISLRSCGSDTKPTTTEIQYKDTTIYVHDTVFKGEGKGSLKYTYSGMIHDTILERMYITTPSGDTVQSFVATLDTIQNKDTLHLEFTYPSAMFRYQLSRQADSFKVVNTTTEIVRFEQVAWYEKPLFVSSVTAGVLVAIFGATR